MPVYSELYITQAPTATIVPLALAKKHLRVDHDDDDDLIAMQLAAATSWAEDYCSQAFAQQQYKWVMANKPFTGAYPFVNLPFPITVYPLWYPWPYVMGQPTDLPRAPLISLDQVAVGTYGQTDQVLDPSDYQADLQNARVIFNAGTVPAIGQDYLSFTFTAGYSDLSALSSTIKAGVLALLTHLYENRGEAGGEMPVFALRLLGMNRRVSFGGG